MNLEYIFSKKDDSIVKQIQRDPMGFLPIWSHFGGRMIPNITTVSNDIRCFSMLVTNLYFAGKFLSKRADFNEFRITGKGTKDAISGLVLTFEELFVYSLLSKKNGDGMGIPGTQKGMKKFEDEGHNPVVGPFDQILVNQINVGIHGRYKTPLENMKIIDHVRKIKGDVVANMEEYFDVINDLEKPLFDFYSKLVDGKSKGTLKFSDFDGQDEIIKVIDISSRQKEFWRNRLSVDSGLLIGRLYKLLSTDAYGGTRNILTSFINTLSGEDRKVVEDIYFLEEYLSRVDILFDEMFLSRDIKRVMEIAEALNIKDAFKEFSRLEVTGQGELRSRFERLKKCEPGSESFIMDLIDYHKSVSQYKGNGAWVDFEEGSGKLIKLNTEYKPKKYDGTVRWKRDYYVNVLYDLKKGLEEEA